VTFHSRQHPRNLGASEVEIFLTHLAVDRKVSASTQNQALQALLFLYRQVLDVDLPWLENVTRAVRPRRVPMVTAAWGAGSMRWETRGARAPQRTEALQAPPATATNLNFTLNSS
jgi:hypothetical protein